MLVNFFAARAPSDWVKSLRKALVNRRKLEGPIKNDKYNF